MQDPMFSLQHHPQNKNKIALISMQREHLPPPPKKSQLKKHLVNSFTLVAVEYFLWETEC